MRCITAYLKFCFFIFILTSVIIFFSDDSVEYIEDMNLKELMVDLGSSSLEESWALNNQLSSMENNILEDSDLFNESIDDLLSDNPLINSYHFKVIRSTARYGVHETLFFVRKTFDKQADVIELTIDHKKLGKKIFYFYVWDKSYLLPSFSDLYDFSGNFESFIDCLVSPEMFLQLSGYKK